MNTSKFKLALLLCLLCLGGTVHARIVTLTIGGTKTNDSITIATNESFTILSGRDIPFNSRVRVEKDGLKLGTEGYSLGLFDPLTDSGLKFPPKIVIAGPAVLTLAGPNINPGFAFLTIDIQPDSFPPDKAVIVPEGSGANIVLESSTNLIHWADATPGLYTNRTGNLFFRIRADRIP